MLEYLACMYRLNFLHVKNEGAGLDDLQDLLAINCIE